MRPLPHLVIACCGLAAALPASAQPYGEAPPTALEGEPAPMREHQRRGVVPHQAVEREAFRDPDLVFVAANSGIIFDGVLVNTQTFTPPDMRVLVTEYTFEVHEWFEAPRDGAPRFITVRETGGLEAEGGGMTTCRSHKLDLTGRYLVFMRADAADVLLPFNRVLQIMDGGAVLADEQGRIATGLKDGVLQVRQSPEVRSLAYFPGAWHDAAERPLAPLPVAVQGEVVALKPDADPPPPAAAAAPMPAAIVLDLLREPGAPPADPTRPGPAGLASSDPTDFLRCGYINNRMNYYYIIPDNNNFTWTQQAMIDWNRLVGPGGAHEWMFGNWTSGGQPIRDRAPVANNNQNNCGVPTSTQMSAGGYGTWAANGNPNGICFRWYDSNCGRIREADAFANPSLQSNQLQFRKTMVHELGHAIGLNHEGRYVAIMVSGTWRVPPNYSSINYLRGDDLLGGRASLSAGNSATPGSFVLRNYRDMLTISQSHPNWGTEGNVGANMTRLSTYTASGGQNVSLQRMFIENRGPQGFSQPMNLRVYLSSNNVISAADTQVAQMSWTTYPGWGFNNNFNINFTVPTTIPSGNYYVGWIITTGDTEEELANNTGILVGDSSTGFAQLTLNVNNAPVPANNTCAAAFTVTEGNSYTGTTTGATNTASATCGLSGSAPDVWYTFTARCNGTLRVDTCGSSFDTVLSAHSACGGTQLVCNDDAPSGACPGIRDSLITLPVTAGSTYKIRVSGYNGATGNFNLNVNMAAPSNDNCTNAINVASGTTPFATCGATTDGPNEPTACNFFGYSHIDNDVWYRYTANCTGTVTVSLCDSTFDTKVAVYGGTCANLGQPLACNDDWCGLRSELSFNATSGQAYLIRIGGYQGARGPGSMNLSCAPANTTLMPIPPFGSTYSFATHTRGLWFQAPVDFTIAGLRVPDETSHGLQNLEVVRMPAAPPVFPGTTNLTSLARFIGVPSAAIIPTQISVSAGDFIGILGACGDANMMFNSYAAVNTFDTSIFGQPMTLRRFGMQNNLVTTPAQDVWTENHLLTRVEVYYGDPTTQPCYANCDNSTNQPILTVDDFTCFINSFASAQGLPYAQQVTHYANCDNSTTVPVLTVDDFTCFINAFAQGCN